MSEQPMPTPGRQAVTPIARELFAAMLDQRERKGIETYGRSLETHNGRDAVQDALEELIDAWQYLVQIKLERDALTAEREELDAAVREHHEAALDKERERVRHWMSERDRFCGQLADERKAHALTQGWLDKFQGEASTQQVRAIRAEQALAKAEAERDAARARAERYERAYLDLVAGDARRFHFEDCTRNPDNPPGHTRDECVNGAVEQARAALAAGEGQ